MAKIYKYQKITDQFTTHCLVEPDYNLLETEDRITELCTIDGVTYVSVPERRRNPNGGITCVINGKKSRLR